MYPCAEGLRYWALICLPPHQYDRGEGYYYYYCLWCSKNVETVMKAKNELVFLFLLMWIIHKLLTAFTITAQQLNVVYTVYEWFTLCSY